MSSLEDLRSMYVSLVDNLKCSICQDTLSDARDLACGHTFCLKCLQELAAFKGWTQTLECPLCKKTCSIPANGLAGLKQNYRLNCILDEQKNIMQAMERESAAAENQVEEVQIWVKDLEGKSQSIIVRLTDKVASLKAKVEKRTGIPPRTQRLIYGGHSLEDAEDLAKYGIQKQSTVQLVIPLKGGQ